MTELPPVDTTLIPRSSRLESLGLISCLSALVNDLKTRTADLFLWSPKLLLTCSKLDLPTNLVATGEINFSFFFSTHLLKEKSRGNFTLNHSYNPHEIKSNNKIPKFPPQPSATNTSGFTRRLISPNETKRSFPC